MARASRTSQARAARQAKMLYDMCAMAIVAGRADLDGADEVGFDIDCRCSRSVAPANSQRASADAPPIRSFGAGGAATHGRRRSPVFAARHLAPCESAAAESGRRHQPGWHRADPFLGRGEPRAAPASRAIARRPVPACSRPMRTVTLWKSNVPAALACGVGRFRSTPVSCRRASPWRPRVSRLMRMTRAVGVSQAKTRGLRGVNPFLSRFLGLSCFGGLTDFQKTLKKNSKTGISCNRCACFVI